MVEVGEGPSWFSFYPMLGDRAHGTHSQILSVSQAEEWYNHLSSSIHPPIHPSIHPPIHPLVHPSIYPFIHQLFGFLHMNADFLTNLVQVSRPQHPHLSTGCAIASFWDHCEGTGHNPHESSLSKHTDTQQQDVKYKLDSQLSNLGSWKGGRLPGSLKDSYLYFSLRMKIFTEILTAVTFECQVLRLLQFKVRPACFV